MSTAQKGIGHYAALCIAMLACSGTATTEPGRPQSRGARNRGNVAMHVKTTCATTAAYEHMGFITRVATDITHKVIDSLIMYLFGTSMQPVQELCQRLLIAATHNCAHAILKWNSVGKRGAQL